jgi:hypothetical protein
MDLNRDLNALAAIENPAAWVKNLLELVSAKSLVENEHRSAFGLQLRKVATKGGYEDAGEYMDAIFAVSTPARHPEEDAEVLFHFRLTGHYNSWDESYWDAGADIVKPEPVQAINWVLVQRAR